LRRKLHHELEKVHVRRAITAGAKKAFFAPMKGVSRLSGIFQPFKKGTALSDTAAGVNGDDGDSSDESYSDSEYSTTASMSTIEAVAE
jgi:hypothetical protein